MLVGMPERSSHAKVAVFDTLEDQQQLTTATLRVLGCRVHPLNPGDNGLRDVVDQLEREGPFDVVLWDLPHALRAPCDEFGELFQRGAFAASGVVITTADRDGLQPMLDAWSAEPAILARPYTFTALMQAIDTARAAGERARARAATHPELAGVACRVGHLAALR
jgi:hypothetical protein